MSTMLERMRARVQERTPKFERDFSVYPFWNLNFNASSILRLIPFNDPYTGAFWSEKVMLPMQFSDPDDPTKVIKYLAPCREMYEHANKCSVLGPVRALYDEEKELRNSGNTKEADKLKRIAGFHWKKPTYYYQGFVVKSGMTEENEPPENPIRVYPFNKMIHKMIYNSIFEADEDPFDTLPCGEFTMDDIAKLLDGGEVSLDIFSGYNFIVKKGKRGEYADWTTDSGWSKSQTSLTDEQLAALAEYGLHDLTKRLPDRPSDANYEVLVEMMDISIQRQLTGENGVWNREWEELGFKPIRQKTKGGNTNGDKPATSSGGSDSKSSGETTSALDRLKAARGKGSTAATVEDNSPAEVAAADDTPTVEAAAEDTPAADATPVSSGDTGVTDLAARIKARVSKQSA